MTYIEKGTPAFLKVNIALFAGGLCTFAILWGTQPLLPEIANEFSLTPAQSSLAQTSATIALAVSMLVAGSLSNTFGRKKIMLIALVSSSLLAILTGFVPNFGLHILLRILQGITLAGIPAIAMAYLGEEMEPKSLGMAMGLYISGNTVGGMGGRVIGGMLTELFSWKIALMGVGLFSLVATIVFWLLLPESKNFQKQPLNLKESITSLGRPFKMRGLLYLFAIGFLLPAGFVSLYNYIGFELIQPPYSLSQTLIGFIFVVYLVGTFSSTWMGMLSDQYGKGIILKLSVVILLIGVCTTLSTNLSLKIIGLAIFTFGFFGAHSISSSWTNQLASHLRSQAASIYLFAYYIGGSIGGTASGTVYKSFGWSGLVVIIVLLAIVSLIAALRLGVMAKNRAKVKVGKVS